MKRVHECVKTCSKCKEKFVGREAYAKHMKDVHKIKLTFRTMPNENRKGYIDSAGIEIAENTQKKIRENRAQLETLKSAEKPVKYTKKGKWKLDLWKNDEYFSKFIHY